MAPFSLPPGPWAPVPGRHSKDEALLSRTNTQEDFGWQTSNATTSAAATTFGAATSSAVQTFIAVQVDANTPGISIPAIGSVVDSTANFQEHRPPDGQEPFPEDMRRLMEGFNEGQPPDRPSDSLSDPSKNTTFALSSEALRQDLYSDLRFSELAAVSTAVADQLVFSEAATQPVTREHVWSCDSSMATPENGAAQDLSMFGADVPEGTTEDIPAEGLVGIHSLDDDELSPQVGNQQSELEKKVDNLLRGLHSPPRRQSSLKKGHRHTTSASPPRTLTTPRKEAWCFWKVAATSIRARLL